MTIDYEARAIAAAKAAYVDGDVDIDTFEAAVDDALSPGFDFREWCDRYGFNPLAVVDDGAFLEGEVVYR